jgi:hypothetical protein
MSRIILVDTTTLIVNPRRTDNKLKQIETEEKYHKWIINAIQGEYVILITNRPEKYSFATIHNLLKNTGWIPDEWYFNTGYPPSIAKGKLLEEKVLPKFDIGTEYIAIEGNEMARTRYGRFGIPSVWPEGEKIWGKLDDWVRASL